MESLEIYEHVIIVNPSIQR